MNTHIKQLLCKLHIHYSLRNPVTIYMGGKCGDAIICKYNCEVCGRLIEYQPSNYEYCEMVNNRKFHKIFIR